MALLCSAVQRPEEVWYWWNMRDQKETGSMQSLWQREAKVNLLGWKVLQAQTMEEAVCKALWPGR